MELRFVAAPALLRLCLEFLGIVLFQAKEFQNKLGPPLVKPSIVIDPEKTENEVGDDTWLVLNVLDQTRFTDVR